MEDTVNATVVIGDILNATVDNTSETVTVTLTTEQEVLNATIVPGAKGDPGQNGEDGAGLPVGGSPNYILAKATVTDYDYEWVDPLSLNDATLFWALANEPSQVISGNITYDGLGGISTADIHWPDGSAGTLTRLVTGPAGAIDSYYVTHVDRGLTFYQPPVTRDGSGNVTYRPLLMGPLAFVTDTNPDRTHVYSKVGGTLLATFTQNARTATLYRTNRTFTEQKPAFTDLFDRTRTNGWGPSPSGGSWGNYNGADSDFSTNGDGLIHPTTTNVSRYVRLNDIVKEFDVRMAASINSAPAGGANSVSLIGGLQATTDHLRFKLVVSTAGVVTGSMTEVVAGVETTLASAGANIGTGYAANDLYYIRATYDGIKTYGVYMWKDGTTEPATPTFSYTYPGASATYQTGKLGVRCLASTGATNDPTFKFTEFSSTSATKWPVAPTVTNNVWVRVAPTAFNGTVNIPWLMTQLVNSTQDDVLANAMKYVTGGSTPAEYGPLYNIGRSFGLAHADDGTRQEGSDWNDFAGINGSSRYTHLVTPKTDAAESYQLSCLDCSGYVRQVYGVDHGMLMCLDDVEDFDGINIPRRSTDQQNYGPGNYVIPHSGGAPPADYSMLLPGDIVFFDADTSNPEEQEGQIDHEGIYLGIDVNDGKARFLSSRKTISGPTMADLGGNSAISGTGLYATRFRAARRY